MTETYETRVTFDHRGITCIGCTLVDTIKAGYFNMYLVEYKPDKNGLKYCCYLGCADENPWFKTKEEAYRYTAEFYASEWVIVTQKMEKIEKIIGE